MFIVFLNDSGDALRAKRISWSDLAAAGISVSVSSNFGGALAFAEDVSRDCIADIAVGADKANGQSGAVCLIGLNTEGSMIDVREISTSSGGLSAWVTLQTGDMFGSSVDLVSSGPTEVSLVVGAIGDDDGGSNSGAIYLIAYNTYAGIVNEAHKISNSHSGLTFFYSLTTFDFFGRSVAFLQDFEGTTVAVGAFGDDGGGTADGAVYIIQLSDSFSAPFSVNKAQKISRTHGGLDQSGLPVGSRGGFFGIAVASMGDRRMAVGGVIL